MSGANLPCLLRATSDFAYVRLHGPDQDYLDAGSYPDADLSWWADRVGEWDRVGRDVFVYFNNDGDANAVRNARTLRAMLAPGSTRPDHRGYALRLRQDVDHPAWDRRAPCSMTPDAAHRMPGGRLHRGGHHHHRAGRAVQARSRHRPHWRRHLVPRAARRIGSAEDEQLSGR